MKPVSVMSLAPTFRSAIAGLLAATLLSGCVERWTKPGGDQALFDRDHALCDQWALDKVPAHYDRMQMFEGYYEPRVTECKTTGNTTRCVTTGGQYVPPTYATVDVNTEQRKVVADACLVENGWTRLD